jgi:glycosyltransferase involved in cell wall biosynthesis
MRLILVADGRSPTTRRWARSLVELGHEVTLITTFPGEPVEGIAAEVCLPVAFSGLVAAGGSGAASGQASAARRLIRSFRGLFLAGRYRLGPLTLRYYGPRLRWLVENIQPDLVHALRIPFEGMLAAYSPPDIPLVISIWGNDLTLHASGSGQMAALTRGVFTRANALMADAARDIRLARAWGLAEEKPTLVVPGSGGVPLAEIDAVLDQVRTMGSRFDDLFDPETPLIVNPRGFRPGSVRQDTFFQALPLVLQRRPNLRFACPAMAGQREAVSWVERLGLKDKVHLLPHLPQQHLWALYARSALTISISQHDGTPNSLLEAMAAGVFPIAGDIESLREWITPGINGLLVEPSKPQALAEAILLSLDAPDLRRAAAVCNRQLVETRAADHVVRAKIDAFYKTVAGEALEVAD